MNRYSVASLAIIACLCGGCTAPTTATTSEGMADSTSTGAAVAVEGADGKPTDNGPQVIHTKDGGRMEGMMRDGQRTGVWTSYFPNGTLRSQNTYVNGKENGPSVVNHPNGIPFYVGQYLQGVNHGQWVFYDEQGNEIKRATFDSTGTEIKP
ncbi:MAG TPA: hypothetical protein PLL25_00615 [Flavobacteriales bacterium]|jgi:hypothetical protein|nr:hypothetical protein [Flavobacteriales bacterium]HOZ39277.1 hypothetical protein [Flavobacteriales bacterium]